jgi:hypothetical protein
MAAAVSAHIIRIMDKEIKLIVKRSIDSIEFL